MERLGLVASIEEQLERMIGAGMLPEDGKLPSEQTLARRFGVSRTTIREALGRLAARGLVVQHPGRKARAVALDETVTLENLGVALHGAGGFHADRQRLLEGYFALKRDATVELLTACREHAAKWEMERVGEACFALWNAARWEKDWVEREFDLLRLAARVARRPGHLLLIHSLERAFRGMRARVVPHLDAEAVSQWAYRAMQGLAEADPLALKRELLPLLRACDERVLNRLAPVRETEDMPRAPRGAAAEPPHVETESTREALLDAASPNLSACRTGSCTVAPEEVSQPGSAPVGACDQPEGNPGAREECVPAAFEAPALSVGTPVRCEWRQGLPCPSHFAGGEPHSAARAQGERGGGPPRGDCLNGPWSVEHLHRVDDAGSVLGLGGRPNGAPPGRL